MKPRIVIRDREGTSAAEYRATARGYGATPEEALKRAELALDACFGEGSWEPRDVEYEVETSEETGHILKVEAWLSSELVEPTSEP